MTRHTDAQTVRHVLCYERKSRNNGKREVWRILCGLEVTHHPLHPNWQSSEIRLVWEKRGTNIVMVTVQNVDSTFKKKKKTWAGTRPKHPRSIPSHGKDRDTENTAVCFISRGCTQNQNGLASSGAPLWYWLILMSSYKSVLLLQKTLISCYSSSLMLFFSSFLVLSLLKKLALCVLMLIQWTW